MLVGAAALAVLGCQATDGTGQTAQADEGGDQAAFDQRVREALLRNPQWLDEVEALQVQRLVMADTRSPTLGRPDAPITLVAFADYRCPFCRQSEEWLFRVAAADPDVRIVFKEFPILGPQSIEAAAAALAAQRQGRYVEMHRALMDVQGEMTPQAIDNAARAAGVNVARMRADMEDETILDQLRTVHETAGELDISATPAFVVNGRVLAGGWDAASVERAIAEARPPSGGR